MLSAAPGKNAVNFLKVDVGGKSVAMAGAQFASQGDSFAQFYNPSLLSTLQRREVGFMHNEFISDLRQEVLTYAHPTKKLGNFSSAFTYFTYGKIEGFDNNGTALGNLRANDMLISLSWAKSWRWVWGEKVFEGISSGVTVKGLSRKFHNDSALGFAFDFGANYTFKSRYLNTVKIAGVVQNLGPGVKFKSETESLPQIIRLGLSRSWFGEALSVMVDHVMTFNLESHQAAAIQYKILKMFNLRFGYKLQETMNQKFTYGVGFENPILRVDYAFVPLGDLGDTHRVSAIYKFGKTSRLITTEEQLKSRIHEAKTLYGQGLLVDAFMICFQIQKVAPWLEENNKFIGKIQKDFRDLEQSDKRDQLIEQAQALFSRGEQFFDSGNLLDARTEFQAVLVLQPENKSAQGYLDQIESQFLSFVESFFRAGMIAFAEENYAKAREEFEKVLTIKPDHAESKQQFARCLSLIETQEKKEKEKVLRFMADKNYQDALEAFKRENYEESYRLFNEVLKLSPKHEEALRYMDLALEKIYRMNLTQG
jgi:tetratricopeptide (TPR) repeat protein